MASKCKVCGIGKLKEFLTLGEMPPVNAFINSKEIEKEKRYPLTLAYCSECFLVQLINIVPPSELFSNYLHLSSASASNVNHLKELAEYVTKRFNVSRNTKILEIGSNDGTLLSFFKKYSSNILAVEPAQNLFSVSKSKGIETIPTFFSQKVAQKILEKKGRFDIIIAINVVPHTPNVLDLLKGVSTILNSNGTFIMEGVYALETILSGEFDTVYHEHVYTFSLHSLISTFKLANLTVIDVEKIPEQGGSLRIFAKQAQQDIKPSKRVNYLLEEEQKLGLTRREIYEKLSPRVEGFKERFKEIIKSEKKSGKLIGIGAPARGVVILNYCGLDRKDIDYIVDDTTLKQGKVTPGVHIPIKSWEALKSEGNRNFILLSWNYSDSLLPRLKPKFSGSKVIVPFPELEVKNID